MERDNKSIRDLVVLFDLRIDVEKMEPLYLKAKQIQNERGRSQERNSRDKRIPS